MENGFVCLQFGESSHSVFDLRHCGFQPPTHLQVCSLEICENPEQPLNIQQTIDVAALISANASHVIDHSELLPEDPLGEYWLHSRRRLSAWLQQLDACRDWQSTADTAPHGWNGYRTLVEEIFLADVLSRVWGAVLTAYDRRRQTSFAEPIAYNVMTGQMQARQIALRSMISAGSSDAERIALIDHTRRRAERWTDVLLGHLVLKYDVEEFAFDPERAREFGHEQANHDVADASRPVWELIFAGLRIAFSTMSRPGARDCHHREIVGAILSTFPSEAFETSGQLKSLARMRLERSRSLPESPATGFLSTYPEKSRSEGFGGLSRNDSTGAPESPGVSFSKAFRNRPPQS